MAPENPASANNGVSGRVRFQDRKARKDLPGLKVHKEPPELQGKQVPRDRKDRRAQPGSREQPGKQANKGHRDHRDQSGLKDCRGFKERRDHWAHRDPRDRPALLDHQQP